MKTNPDRRIDLFSPASAEQFLTQRLREHGRIIDASITDPKARIEHLRRLILDGHLECAIIGKNAGKAETYAQFYERLYGEPLIPKSAKSSKEKPHAPA